eukprot:TRINITY_DN105555_c2_g1_i1.p1 TRINITY_DN105555_c2_g1~~TRINITY_DN105555_c2_g1_i1.p1  ORF type:complete len:525 (-),score=52.47 TRINITY_DN105555_c2_g1_i1:1395-2969(-)
MTNPPTRSPNRIPQLLQIHRDFYAPLTQKCTLPDYPVQQKFVHLPLTQTNNHKYSLSSVELNKLPQICTNFLLDQKIDLMNPSTYAVPYSTVAPTIPKEDEFLLAPAESESGQHPSRSMTISVKSIGGSRYEALASKMKYYWRQTTFLSQHTTSSYGKNVDAEDVSPTKRGQALLAKLSEKQRKAIDVAIIKETFEDVKKFTVGSEKPGAKGVTAKRVLNIQPFFEYMPNRLVLSIFDHDVKENLHPAAKEEMEKEGSINSLLIMKKFGYDTNRSAAIYSKATNNPLVHTQKDPISDDTEIVLGRAEYQYKREYDYFINTESQLRHNAILYVKGDHAKYLKPSSIFIMNKKKASIQETGTQLPQSLFIEARGYSKEEIAHHNKKYEAIGVCLLQYQQKKIQCGIRIDEGIVDRYVVEEPKEKQPEKTFVEAESVEPMKAPEEENKVEQEAPKVPEPSESPEKEDKEKDDDEFFESAFKQDQYGFTDYDKCWQFRKQQQFLYIKYIVSWEQYIRQRMRLVVKFTF